MADYLDMIADFDETTRSKIDLQNPVRVARAWEVLQATGKSIVSWQANTPPPLLDIKKCDAIHMHSRQSLAKSAHQNTF